MNIYPSMQGYPQAQSYLPPQTYPPQQQYPQPAPAMYPSAPLQDWSAGQMRYPNPPTYQPAPPVYPPYGQTQSFQPIDQLTATTYLRGADTNNDGKATARELAVAGRSFHVMSRLSYGGRHLTNIADMFTALAKEVASGNPDVDANGDGAISIRPQPTNWQSARYFAPEQQQPSELAQIIARNNPNALEAQDLEQRFYIQPYPMQQPGYGNY